MPSNRDNFLEIVKAWCDYARICQAVKHEPVTLQSFRAMECEWDGPLKANIGKSKPIRKQLIINSVKVRPYSPTGDNPSGQWAVTIYTGAENKPTGGTVVVNSPTAKMAAASEIAQYLYELDLLEVADK